MSSLSSLVRSVKRRCPDVPQLSWEGSCSCAWSEAVVYASCKNILSVTSEKNVAGQGGEEPTTGAQQNGGVVCILQSKSVGTYSGTAWPLYLR